MEDIFQWCREGVAMQVRVWLDDTEHDMNQGDDHGFSPLHWAAKEGHLKVVEMLVQRGARINSTNRGDDTPLHLAAAHGHHEIVHLLLKNRADINFTNEHGNTPLHYACFWGYEAIAEELIENGALAAVANKDGDTPLDKGKGPIVKHLKDLALQSGQDLTKIIFKDQSWLGLKTRSRDATLSRHKGINLSDLYLHTKMATSPSGETWRGHWQKNDIVAKVLAVRQCTPRISRDFNEEFPKLRIFSHPNVLPVIGCCNSPPNLVVISQYMPWGSLYNLLHEGARVTVDTALALRLAVDVARAMAFLHSLERIIPQFHLNSHHIMIDEDLTAKINMADAKFSFQEKARVYYPGWMAPEALQKKQSDTNSEACDMWSFAILLWELATREVPFSHLSPMEIGMKVALEGLRVTIPLNTSQHLTKLIKICMNEDPGKRPTFDMRSFFPYQNAIKDEESPAYRENNFVHQKYNKSKPKMFEFTTYCSMTSLHGFCHFVENNFNNVGKIFWAICLVVIYILCGYSVYMLIVSYFTMRPIISLDSTVSWIWTIPFPAVTMCSANKMRLSTYNYSDANSDQSIRNVMHNICEKMPTTKQLKDSDDYLHGSFVSQVLKNLSFPCSEVINFFSWMQVSDNDVCSVWVQETFTSYGLCYSFNMMPMGDLLNGVDEWSQEGGYGWKNYQSGWQPDSGYSDDALSNHLPLRTLSNTEYYSAKMKLNLHVEDFNRECSHGLDVFYILIHSPAEWPDRSHPTLIASINTLETLSVNPTVITTSKDLISSDPDKRNCYFQNERKLRFFKIYTEKNCILECRSDNILSKCGCVPFYHLRMKNTPVCGPAKMSCWTAASQISSNRCGCLPGCTELYFKLSPTKANFNQSNEQAENENTSFLSSVLLSISYRHRNYIGFHRIMTSTFSQFAGNVGGIMGLCLGFSFLSLAEIIYFLTLRPLVNFRNEKKKMKKVEPVRIFEKTPISYID